MSYFRRELVVNVFSLPPKLVWGEFFFCHDSFMIAQRLNLFSIA